jgi:hypothetical protein
MECTREHFKSIPLHLTRGVVIVSDFLLKTAPFGGRHHAFGLVRDETCELIRALQPQLEGLGAMDY